MDKRKQLIFSVVLLLFAVLFAFFVTLFTSDSFYSLDKSDPERSFHEQRDLKNAAGLLMPTDKSVPVHFRADKKYDGFGSNDGCYSATYWEKYETKFYCFRYFDPATAEYTTTNGKENYELPNAETIKFEANAHKNNAPINLDGFVPELFLQYLNNKQTVYTEEQFMYQGQKGTMVTFTTDRLYGNQVYKGDRLHVKKLFWKDNETSMVITWSKPGIVPDSTQLMNILPTLRHSDGQHLLEEVNDTSAPPYLVR